MSEAWPDDIYEALKRHGVRQVAYVPDAGHTTLINRCHADNDMTTVVLTTEEEGIAMLAGAWLGGDKGVLLMQSSGVGNCVNMFTLLETCRLPFLTLVTMRGEWGEFNPWQVPMGRATAGVLEGSGLSVYRVDETEDVGPTVDAALHQVFDGMQGAAILLSQRLIGRKAFTGTGESSR